MVPVLATLASGSILAGYASHLVFPAKSRSSSQTNTQGISVETAQFVKEDKPEGKATALSIDDGTSGQMGKPVEDYKAALDLLKKNHYGEPLDPKKTRLITYDGIRGMLGGLRDVYTSFFSPEEWKAMQEENSGSFEGIGALLVPNEALAHKEIIVQEPIENSPAEKAGIKAKDVIVKVDGKSVIGKTTTEAVKLIRGTGGTVVHLSIVRGKQNLEFNITRAAVESPHLKYSMVDPENKIGLIRLDFFSEKSGEQVARALIDLKKKGAKAILLDLRGNPGGLLTAAIDIASIFVPTDIKPDLKNVVIYSHEGSGRETNRKLRGDFYLADGLPIAVLVNENTASASEIVTGCIKDYGVGTIIGERTYGKGKVQSLYPLPGNCGVKVTTALYYPPGHVDINYTTDEDGNRIPKTGGIMPDIVVAQPDNDPKKSEKENDLQMTKALEFLRGRVAGKTTQQALVEGRRALGVGR